MNHETYLSLVNDTLTHIRDLLPKREEVTVPKVILPSPPKLQPKASPPPPKPAPVITPPPPSSKPALKKGVFDVEIPKSPPPESTEGVRKILREIAPELYLHDKPLSDYKAKRIKEAWKEKRGTPAIPILFQGSQYRKFVEKIAKAIDTVYGSCRLVEITTGKKWDDFLESDGLKLIIAPDLFIFGNKELLPFYQETPQQKIRKLGNIPLLLLPDLSLYFKDPYLKRSLWNVICNTINSL
ncbi:MAG: hypothetical protein H7A38_02825 [Chlamydiales bacterium]|nr:hypothetical protein [Chlamydiales bacterium]